MARSVLWAWCTSFGVHNALVIAAWLTTNAAPRGSCAPRSATGQPAPGVPQMPALPARRSRYSRHRGRDAWRSHRARQCRVETAGGCGPRAPIGTRDRAPVRCARGRGAPPMGSHDTGAGLRYSCVCFSHWNDSGMPSARACSTQLASFERAGAGNNSLNHTAPRNPSPDGA